MRHRARCFTHQRLIDADDSRADVEVAFVFDGVGCRVIVIMTALTVLGEAVEMLQTQIEISFVCDECADSDERCCHFMERQPLVEFLFGVEWNF